MSASLFDTSVYGGTPLFAPQSALTDLTVPTSLFSSLQIDPTALLVPESMMRGADFALSPSLRFNLAATPNQVSLIPAYGQADPLANEIWQNNSLHSGLSWNFAKWGDIGLIASRDNYFVMSNDRPTLASVSRVNSDALGVSAHVGLGGGWVTMASYSEGLSQLDLRPDAGTELHTQAYSFAIAKHGLFGNDALGFSFSQPAAGTNTDLVGLMASDDLPTVYPISHFSDQAVQETDLQLGYVTSYFNGALALQTNASYQMNVQGQSGANALTMLSRAKIKF
ncbi:MAG TPA: hypothetical protein VIJ72_05895 [Rhizomicrobium sp.]